VERHGQQQAPRAGRRLLDVDLPAARELEHDARLAQRVVQALGAGHEGREPDRGPRAQARGDAPGRRRRGAPRLVGRAGGEQRPRHAVLLQRERGGELLDDGGHDPARAVGLLGAQRDRPLLERPRVGVAVGQQAGRIGARALAQRAQQGRAAAHARRLAHEGQRDQRGAGVQVAEGRPGRGVAGCSGGSREGHAEGQSCQPTLCARSRSPVHAVGVWHAARRDRRLHLARRGAHRALRPRSPGRRARPARRRLRAACDPADAGAGARSRRRRRRRAPRAGRARRRGGGRPARRRRGRAARRPRGRARRRRGQGAGRRPRRRRPPRSPRR
jgi:hypothetical protein